AHADEGDRAHRAGRDRGGAAGDRDPAAAQARRGRGCSPRRRAATAEQRAGRQPATLAFAVWRPLVNGHGESARLASRGGGDGVSPLGERGISPGGDARHNTRGYVFRIARFTFISVPTCRGYWLTRGVGTAGYGSVVSMWSVLDAESRVSKCHLFPI